MTLGAGDAGYDALADAGRLAPCDGMRQQGAMKTSITWSPAAGLNVVSVERREQAWTVTVDSRQPNFCPGCGAQSKSRHSTYWRALWDLSAQGAPVVVNARLGRWRCRNQQCDRLVFIERVPSLAAPFARRTARLSGIVRLLGHSAGGRPSERLMRRLGMPVSDTTILAGLRKHARVRSESSAVAAVHVAGIDDWAWRKGSNYGTIIVDLEHRVVVDVLADRSAATTASWFRDHPEVEMVSRDRAGLYAEAAREGAPQARQIADRFHLLQNFREIVERQLGGYEAAIRDTRINASDNHAASPLPERLDRPSDAVAQTRLIRRERQAVRQQVFDKIRALFEGGSSIGEIARNLGLGRRRVERWSVASICRTATQWRRRLTPRRISAFFWSGGGPKALPKSGTCSPRYAIVAIPGPSVIWRVSLHPGAAASLPSRTPSRRSQPRSVCERWIQ